MSIWHGNPERETADRMSRGTLVEHLDIRFIEVGDDFVSASMPVDKRTIQPFGLLHGGASVALAETLGSVAANLAVDSSRYYCVGLEINANHVRGVRTGRVTGTARPLHIGGTTHVWQIEIRDEADRLTCVSRITMAVLERHD